VTLVEKPLEGEFVEDRAIVKVEQEALIATFDPDAVIARASRQATALADILEKRKLYTVIQGRKHVNVEGWQTLGALNGLQAFTERVQVARTEDGFIEALAIVSARRVSDGTAVAQVEGFCSTRESRWKGRDEYAVRSMAQTRATSKVFRQALAWVMVLAGYEATPQEETPGDHGPDALTSPEERAYQVAWKAANDEARDAARKFLSEKGYKAGEFAVRGRPHYHEALRLLGAEVAP
jgi:hypothetical protein